MSDDAIRDEVLMEDSQLSQQSEGLVRQQSDALKALADRLQATNPHDRETWEAIDSIRAASRHLFSAAGWLYFANRNHNNEGAQQ